MKFSNDEWWPNQVSNTNSGAKIRLSATLPMKEVT